jgi:hypothetical protein
MAKEKRVVSKVNAGAKNFLNEILQDRNPNKKRLFSTLGDSLFFNINQQY